MQVLFVNALSELKLCLQVDDQGLRKHCDPVLISFPVSDDDLPKREVQVFDPEPCAFHGSQPAAVQELTHELRLAGQAIQNLANFCPGEDRRYVNWPPSADRVDGEIKRGLQDCAIEEQDCVKSLILGRGGNTLVNRQVGEEGLDLGTAHVNRMPFAMEENVPSNPRKVLLFGAVGVMLAAEDRAGPVEQFFRG